MKKAIYTIIVMLLVGGMIAIGQINPITPPKSSTSKKEKTSNSSSPSSTKKKTKTKDKKQPRKSSKKADSPQKTEGTSIKDKKQSSSESTDNIKKDPFGNVKDIDYEKYLPKNKDKKKTDTNDMDLTMPTKKNKSRQSSDKIQEQKDIIIRQAIDDMIYIVGGTFTMGATSEQGGDAFDNEIPNHRVSLADFYISKYEVTQELWLAVMESNPSNFRGNDRLPVEQVSWDDCQEFIRKLNVLTDMNFRLPTEAEWEFAARGGNRTLGYKYSGSNIINSIAWHAGNCFDLGKESLDYGTHPVGTKSPNELGLYDMSGNVWEWCQDWNGEFDSKSQTNPTGPLFGSERVCRGGSWRSGAANCRVTARGGNVPTDYWSFLGLRLAL